MLVSRLILSAIRQSRRARLLAVLRSSSAEEPFGPGDEGIDQLADRAWAHLVPDSQRHGAESGHVIRAKGLVKDGEDGSEIAAGTIHISRMVPAVHHRRNEQILQWSVGPRYVRVDELSVVVTDRKNHRDRPLWKAHGREAGNIDDGGRRTVDWMKSPQG